MVPIGNYNEIETNQEFKRLPAGGYIIKIVDAKDKDNKNYFEVIYDIAVGEYKGFFAEDYYKDKPYMHRLICSYKDSALRSFKGFITSLEESNNLDLSEKVMKGTLDASDLIGRTVGALLGYEEYQNERGDTRQRLCSVAGFRSVKTINDGKFKVPELKTLKVETEAAPSSGFIPITDEDLPF